MGRSITPSHGGRFSRSGACLLAILFLMGCVTSDATGPMGGESSNSQRTGAGPNGQRIVILAPLSGPHAELGVALVQAARIGLEMEGTLPLAPLDTAGTAEGATVAAQTAIASGVAIILGPLTSAETAAVAPLAQAAGIPVLAFTNDITQARPGVWALGITPAQQVQRLAEDLQGQGKERIAGLLPDNDVGRAMNAGLVQAAAALGLPEPRIRVNSAGSGIGSLNGVVRDMADYANRRGPIDAEVRATRSPGTAEARRRAAQIGRRGVPGAPFDALLLADTGDVLEVIASLLPYYDVDSPPIRVLGPALWSAAQSGGGRFNGARYAAPDPSSRGAFERAYITKTGTAPPAIADVAFDAATVARATADSSFGLSALIRSSGFNGANGPLALLANGRARRGLAIFEIKRGGPQMVEPALQANQFRADKGF